MAGDLTREEMLEALRVAIEENPASKRNRNQQVLLKYLELAHEEGLEPLTCKQLAKVVGIKRSHAGDILRRLGELGLARHEQGPGSAYLWYYVK